MATTGIEDRAESFGSRRLALQGRIAEVMRKHGKEPGPLITAQHGGHERLYLVYYEETEAGRCQQGYALDLPRDDFVSLDDDTIRFVATMLDKMLEQQGAAG